MNPRACWVAVGVLLALLGGCGGQSTDRDEPPVELPTTAVVFETHEEACRDLGRRIATGEVEPSDRQLLTADARATAEMNEISDQLFAYADVVYAGATECGASTAVSVGVSTRRASVPEEIDGVPLVVFFQRPIEPF